MSKITENKEAIRCSRFGSKLLEIQTSPRFITVAWAIGSLPEIWMKHQSGTRATPQTQEKEDRNQAKFLLKHFGFSLRCKVTWGEHCATPVPLSIPIEIL